MAKSSLFAPKRDEKNLFQKVVDLNWMIVLVLCFVAAIGIAMLYSVAGGTFEPWASRQAIRFVMLLGAMLAMAMVSIRFWMWASYPAYAIGLLMLIAVELVGATGMGGQRWLDMGLVRVQPSELMKVALVMALARYFHALNMQDMFKLRVLIIPLLMIALPAALVMRQPDLGTALLLTFG
ncbi:MAG: FtsW/RodA/SpoVE family cell cycle protein, partial [Sphingomonadales bacterium]|nr:FtsW/RodA/SpoVE family cell cycle protein [Sphingomonadales bacterium]